MKTVEITYRRWWKDRVQTIRVPEEWPDMTGSQSIAAARCYIDSVNEDDFIADFYDIPKSVVLKMSEFQKYRLTELLEFVFNPDGLINSFYLPEVAGLRAPGNRLHNITVEHFGIFDTYFFDFAHEKTDEALDRFVAALYLKSGEVITRVDMSKRIKKVSTIDKPTKYAIFLNYIFIRKWLSVRFSYLFQVSDESKSKKNLPAKVSKKSLPDWNGMIENVMGDDVLHYNEYKSLPCILFFKQANKKLKQYQNAK
jgi:hypothetical protein